jgi:hypothetical protein
MGTALGFEFAMDQNVNVLTTGTRHGTPANFQVATTSTTGDTTLAVKGFTALDTIKAGEIISIAGVNAVNPENQTTTGYTACFVVMADATLTDGTGTLSIYPSIVLAGAAIANGTVTALPQANAVITLCSGTASTDYPMNVAYHQDAFTLATADLEQPKGVDFAARETYDGVSMLIVRAYDINYQQFPCRIDVLAGWACLRPELACRITG